MKTTNSKVHMRRNHTQWLVKSMSLGQQAGQVASQEGYCVGEEGR